MKTSVEEGAALIQPRSQGPFFTSRSRERTLGTRLAYQRAKWVDVGLSRLCSATFEQLLAFGATFCGFSNLEQVLPFRAIFEQNIGLGHISTTKKSTISWKTSIHANFLKAYHVINLLNTKPVT